MHPGKKESAAERRIKVWELRKTGASYRKIAQKLSVSHEQVRKDCERVFGELTAEAVDRAEEWRVLQLHRCEDAIQGLWPAASSGEVGAVTALMKVLQRQSELLGLDAPRKQELTGRGGGAIEMDIETHATYSVEERDKRILEIIELARTRTDSLALSERPDLDTSGGSTDSRVA